MHSSFTYNPNAHRAPSNYQQQSGATIFNIGAPPTRQGGFMNLNHHHPNFIMTRSYASVVSCEGDLMVPQNVNNNPSILQSVINHFTHKQPTNLHYQPPTQQQTSSKQKQFEDFSYLPPRQFHQEVQYPCYYYQSTPQSTIPIITTTIYQTPPPPQSAKPQVQRPQPAMVVRNFVSNFLNGYQQQSQPQTRSRGRGGWFRNRCNYGWQRNNNNNGHRGNKLQDHDVNLPKHVHEKERSSIERDIKDDFCDFVDVTKDEELMNHVREQNTTNETARGSKVDPPFTISSFEDFPAIKSNKKSEPKVLKSAPPTSKPELPTPPQPQTTVEKPEEDFVIFPAEASISTPSVSPPRVSLCDKIMKSPQKLLRPLPKLPMGFKPCLKPIAVCQIQLKPCLKPPRRTVSECSDDYIVFAHDSKDGDSEDEEEDDDDDDGVDSGSDDDDGVDSGSDDEDEVDGNEDSDEESESEESSESEEESEAEDERDGEISTPEQHVDSGMEEKKIRFNLTPTVHVMRVWDFAYRAYRKGDYWCQFARDHERFQKRIADQAKILNPILQQVHRDKIFKERFQEENVATM